LPRSAFGIARAPTRTTASDPHTSVAQLAVIDSPQAQNERGQDVSQQARDPGLQVVRRQDRAFFGDGITGVIGPNGCGKTNVSDAIRWVMGEQSAKQLRGDSMEDVIFNGCPPASRSAWPRSTSPSRTTAGILPTEYSEVTVSRRVFRSGMSEYFLNKTPCGSRTSATCSSTPGMGSHAYSVIERSMVDHVCPTTRAPALPVRGGLGHHQVQGAQEGGAQQARRHRGDLTRLNDIVFEIERELRSLARQVGKARRHQRLRDEIRDLDLA
jgi:chromosome segregation protein